MCDRQVQQEAGVLQDKLAEMTRVNDQLSTENKKLQILAGRAGAGSTPTSSSKSSSKIDDDSVSDFAVTPDRCCCCVLNEILKIICVQCSLVV